MARPRLAVVGSINMDLVVDCDSLPLRGQTVIGHSLTEFPGGKGANQAVAAARLGASVSLVGRVGTDEFAIRLLANLRKERVDIQFVQQSTGTSGVAIVSVESSGENTITIIAGANAKVSSEDVLTAEEAIRSSDLLLLQLEIPLDTVVAAATVARKAGVRTILDPAPAPDSLPLSLFEVDLICPNQSEAASILNRTIETTEQAFKAADEFRQRGVKNAIITMGSEGAVVATKSGIQLIESPQIKAIDTTAAGDAFSAALAVTWTENDSLIDAVRIACAAGAFAATRVGAQSALPKRTDIE